MSLAFNDNWGITNLTSFDGAGLTMINYLDLTGNPITPSVNNQILSQLNQNGFPNGTFRSVNGRTAPSTADYDNLLNNLGWALYGLDLVTPPPTGNGKLRIKGINSGI